MIIHGYADIYVHTVEACNQCGNHQYQGDACQAFHYGIHIIGNHRSVGSKCAI